MHPSPDLSGSRRTSHVKGGQPTGPASPQPRAPDPTDGRPVADIAAEIIAATVDAIKALPPADGVAEVLVPGERGRRCSADRLVSGVPLGAKVWRELSGAAEALGVALPTPLTG